ncbi:rho guanine nucleotide exchange factor 7 isoform X7 [Leopardus geoffroyi]|uniref:rho guanine nucleotide exchange factor 7 isoform X7 n=1 Tax=Leopardus geoffroyi TaxID=46844 RepID=UPI001E26008C|nr:rho guanine nucleotide exchange factor 7 isoform X7 [Leopardus geoffroyi]
MRTTRWVEEAARGTRCAGAPCVRGQGPGAGSGGGWRRRRWRRSPRLRPRVGPGAPRPRTRTKCCGEEEEEEAVGGARCRGQAAARGARCTASAGARARPEKAVRWPAGARSEDVTSGGGPLPGEGWGLRLVQPRGRKDGLPGAPERERVPEQYPRVPARLRGLPAAGEKPVSPKSGTLKSPPKGFDTTAINKSYYNVVLQNILETENEYSKELQTVLSTYLRPLQTSEKLSSANISYLMGNLEEICSFQQMLVQSLEECTKLPEAQQRVGGCFLNLMPQMKTLYLAYCANHPSAVNVLTEHSEQLGEFMETRGASSPGILVLTTGLSRPFMRLDKYPTLLKELERHMEDYHPDRQDIQKSMTAFKNLSAQCQEVRKRKELELQILTEAIRSWEGDDITTLGSVVYMSQVMVQCAGSEEKNERYLLLFPNSLLMLSASPRMSGFIYQGKLPTTGMTITKLEDSENHRNAFEISGSMIERILVSCNNQQDLHEWVDHLQKQTKVTSVGNPTIKPHSVPSHTLPSHPIAPSGKHADSKPAPLTPAYHTLPHPSHHGTPHTTINWGPLEPPKTPKPWSLSCLRPAPPLRPSAALCYKEDLSKSPKTMKKLLPKRKPERKPSDEEFALRKSTAALEEDAQILKVIEAYCTSAKTRQTLNSTWQGTDLMHNHVLADDDQSSLDSLGRRSSLSRLEPSDLSEDSDYDSIWTAHSYRMGSTSRSRKESAPQVLLPEEEKIIVEETKSNGQTVIEEKSLVDTVYALKDEVQELRQDNKKMKKSLEEEQRARKDLEKLVRKVLKNMNDPAWDETNL